MLGIVVFVAVCVAVQWADRHPRWPVPLAFRLLFGCVGGPVILKCSACGKELTRVPTGWEFTGLFTVWLVFITAAIGRAQGALWWELFFPIVIVYGIAERRARYAYFAWRHPTRCQGGGHIQPEGSSA